MTFLFGSYDSSETDGQAAHHHVVVMSRQRLFLLGLVLKIFPSPVGTQEYL